MKVYKHPANALYSGHSLLSCVTQYTIDFGQCPNANPLTHNQILEVIDSDSFQLEFCSQFSNIPEGSVVGSFQCFETGSLVYSEEVVHSSSGSHLTCNIDETDLVMTIHLESSLPETCTISHAGQGSEVAC